MEPITGDNRHPATLFVPSILLCQAYTLKQFRETTFLLPTTVLAAKRLTEDINLS